MQERFLTISLFLGLGGAEGRIAECMEIIEKAAHGRVLVVAAGCWVRCSGDTRLQWLLVVSLGPRRK